MNNYGIKEMAAAFRVVRRNTIQIAEEIPEADYGYRMAPATRSVSETLVHIAVSTRFPEQIHMVERRRNMAGFDFATMMTRLLAEEQAPRSKSEVVALLRSEGEHFAQALENLPEDALADRVGFPQGMVPPEKSRFEMLLGPKEHEMHHRAQLMVAQRMLGLTPHLTRQAQERMASFRAAQSATQAAS